SRETGASQRLRRNFPHFHVDTRAARRILRADFPPLFPNPVSAPRIEAVLKVDSRIHGPTHLTILPTYRCTAACEQCCFESNPHVQGRIPLERILGYIDQAADDFPTLRLVVFSGGECFLLRDDLDAAIARATARGLATRCVTNGYWATSPRAARERIAPLYDA